MRSVVLFSRKGFRWLQIFLHRGLHQVGALREGGATVTVESVLIGGDLDHRQAHALRLAFNDADVLDARGGHSARCARGLLLLRCLLLRYYEGSGNAEQTGARDRLQKVAAL